MELTIKENDNIPLFKILNKWIDAINEVEEIDYTETIENLGFKNVIRHPELKTYSFDIPNVEHINNDTFKMCFPKHMIGTRLEDIKWPPEIEMITENPNEAVNLDIKYVI